jgi:hypothetical protein
MLYCYKYDIPHKSLTKERNPCPPSPTVKNWTLAWLPFYSFKFPLYIIKTHFRYFYFSFTRFGQCIRIAWGEPWIVAGNGWIFGEITPKWSQVPTYPWYSHVSPQFQRAAWFRRELRVSAVCMVCAARDWKLPVSYL